MEFGSPVARSVARCKTTRSTACDDKQVDCSTAHKAVAARAAPNARANKENQRTQVQGSINVQQRTSSNGDAESLLLVSGDGDPSDARDDAASLGEHFGRLTLSADSVNGGVSSHVAVSVATLRRNTPRKCRSQTVTPLRVSRTPRSNGTTTKRAAPAAQPTASCTAVAPIIAEPYALSSTRTPPPHALVAASRPPPPHTPRTAPVKPSNARQHVHVHHHHHHVRQEHNTHDAQRELFPMMYVRSLSCVIVIRSRFVHLSERASTYASTSNTPPALLPSPSPPPPPSSSSSSLPPPLPPPPPPPPPRSSPLLLTPTVSPLQSTLTLHSPPQCSSPAADCAAAAPQLATPSVTRSLQPARARALKLAYMECGALLYDIATSDASLVVTLTLNYARQQFLFDIARDQQRIDRLLVPFGAVRAVERARSAFRLHLTSANACVFLRKRTLAAAGAAVGGGAPCASDGFAPCERFVEAHDACASAPLAIEFEFHTRNRADKHWALLANDSLLGAMIRADITNLYAVREMLGSGAHAVVRRAVRKRDNVDFAVKIIDKRPLLAGVAARLRAEFAKLRALAPHAHIVRAEECFETADRIFIVEEYCAGGDLFGEISAHRALSEHATRIIARQLLSALAHLHAPPAPIVHRDLKPENIMLLRRGAPYHIKLIDFGLSKMLECGAMATTFAGTAEYVAPEIIAVREGDVQAYGVECDVWSAGAILFTCLAGFTPFQRDAALCTTHSHSAATAVSRAPPSALDARESIFRRVRKGEYSLEWTELAAVSANAKALLRWLMTVDCRQRPSAAQALTHDWFQ